MNKINLLPDHYIEGRKGKPRKIISVLLLLVFGIIFVGLPIITISYYRAFQLVEAQVAKVYAEDLLPLLEEEVELSEVLEAQEEKVQLYRELLDERISWSQVFKTIAQITPEDLEITSLTTRADEDIIINGFASERVIAEFIANLNTEDLFGDVSLRHITPQTHQDTYRPPSFQIVTSLADKRRDISD